MVETKQDATVESSPTLADAIASSPEALEDVKQQISDTQTPTAEKGESQEQVEPQVEESRVPYTRLKEVVDEKNYWREMALKNSQLQQQSQQSLQQPNTLPQEIGNTPEEREFWNMQRRIAREEAQKEQAKLQPLIDATRQELARIGVTLFRKDHPEVKPDSREEAEIAQRISMGYPTEEAYRVVMWDRKVAEVEKQANNNVKQKIEAKKQANVEQRSIPSGATPPTKEKLTLRQRIEREAANMEF